jgi:hypothetical protein
LVLHDAKASSTAGKLLQGDELALEQRIKLFSRRQSDR